MHLDEARTAGARSSPQPLEQPFGSVPKRGLEVHVADEIRLAGSGSITRQHVAVDTGEAALAVTACRTTARRDEDFNARVLPSLLDLGIPNEGRRHRDLR